MQKKRQPSEDDVNRWLQKINGTTGFQVRRIDHKHWQIGMRNHIAEYTLDIQDQDPWITYGIPLTPDVEGKELATFYGELLDLNGQLNGSHIGRQGNNLILQERNLKENLSPQSLIESIALINSAHQVVFSEMIKKARRLGMRFRRK